MKTPLGTEVDLGPGHIALDVVPALRQRGIAAPLLSAHVYCGHGRPSQLQMSSCLKLAFFSRITHGWVMSSNKNLWGFLGTDAPSCAPKNSVKSLNEHKALILTKKNHALAASLLKPLTSTEEASHLLCRLSSTSSQVTLVPVNDQKTTMVNYTNRPPCNVIWPERFHIRWILAISVQENAAKQNR